MNPYKVSAKSIKNNPIPALTIMTKHDLQRISDRFNSLLTELMDDNESLQSKVDELKEDNRKLEDEIEELRDEMRVQGEINEMNS